MEIISDFGINTSLLLAQIVNFLILLFILNRILFKPLLKVLDERKQKIAQSLKEAEQISAELAQAEKKSREIVSSANLKAEELVSEAKEAASQIHLEAQNQAKGEAEKILKKGKETLELEREKIRSSLRRELMDVVVLATEKILGKSLSKEEKEVITKNSLKELS